MRRRNALAAMAMLCSLVGCGDDDHCGPGDAPPDGVTVAAATFGGFRSSVNNDCTAPDGGPTSVTIEGTQTDPDDPDRFFVLCLPRPDAIGDQPIPLDDDELVQLVALSATPGGADAGCRLTFPPGSAPTGATITFTGYCGEGSDPAGFAITLDGELALRRSCATDGGPGDDEPVSVPLSGRASVVTAE